MKKVVIFLGFAVLFASCVAKPYQQTAVDKETQRGFHHNQAQTILDANAKNKAKNAKSSEKEKAELNSHLNALNKNKIKGASDKQRIFNFY